MAKKTNTDKPDAHPETLINKKNYSENDLVSLVIDDVAYKTLLSKKYVNRKPYEPKDTKKVFSFIPGTVKKVYVKAGKKVKTGDKLVDLEAMKMLNTIVAADDYTVAEVFVKEGSMIPKNFLMICYK